MANKGLREPHMVHKYPTKRAMGEQRPGQAMDENHGPEHLTQ
jgi:hypothetical protein